MMMASNVTGGPKMADGLYIFEGGYSLWIENRVLFYGVDAIPPGVAIGPEREVRSLRYEGWPWLYFVRARDVMELSPSLAEGVKAIAAKYQLTV